jgi:translation elongation factor P/translation initiation factor 5A
MKTLQGKNSIKIVTVNGHTYQMSAKALKVIENMAREAFVKTKQRGIIALEKDNYVIMMKETYDTQELLDKAILDYTVKGFKVRYVK